MNDDATPGNVPLSDQLGPVAEVKCGRLQWAIPRDDYRLPLRFLNNDTHPLYDQAALDAAVAAERERCVKLAAWLQWCLDNCDDSAEWNFGTKATTHMRALLAGGDAPMPEA